MKALYLFLGILTGTFLHAQNMILQDPVSGKVFSSEKYSGINGSPFLYDKSMPGSVTIAKGIYINLELKLDAYSNKIYFTRNDELYEFEYEASGFTLKPKINDSVTYMYFKNGFTADGLRPAQYLQIIMEGPVSLYRSDIKLVTDVNEMNKGVIKTFSDATKYYVKKDDKLKSIKLVKDDVLELVKEKMDKIQPYIDQNSLSTKKTEHLLRILRFYNSL